MKTFYTKNEDDTKNLAASLAEQLEAGDVLLLEGNLGAGKTTFTKGLAEGLGISRVIKSPTYTLIREYDEGRLPLYHMDVYRLEETGGTDLGLEEYFEGEGVSVIEWATFIPEDIPEQHLEIQLQPVGIELMERKITFIAKGGRYEKLLEEWKRKEGE
ncbi:tRNA (adenosine(37)-N6)-threonylcarbamoyltransferase complex ATPase subunit type 1 TsaE [Desemzia sp. RIT804]|uniref:tRNA (adenosine(37)-N6)-threonylcarbamoyltransferase complex ATPase subunit type 1 TsaE n=1 Tax=Desemzia sp. RIT 804 TaxID=2810209 RepID=UPI00195231B6|nr:tRNA (adenosine(37)-N6)-threonylcarbamoyltransferase complex ATPase subunit type 1 TsaE [Desemzia sp. RIT 804]MBM6614629.1 tRNA (adenosine(37)-N6)-threonylcarbamoyltransferase complex ATPase subunit type 1 TsaE [Desemzia sp. RIT 804]